MFSGASMFSLSRSMRPSDYEAMPEEVARVDYCQQFVQPPHPLQHKHRRWEQALAWRATREWAKDRDFTKMRMSDWGCGVGLLPALLAFAGANVDLFEPWVYGVESDFVHRQMAQVLAAGHSRNGQYVLENKCLCELNKSWWERYDASFCISTIEHIGEYEKAFCQLCKTVKHDGMIFLTMDYGDGVTPDADYSGASVRPRGMPNKAYMEKLQRLGEKHGFKLFGEADWDWRPECLMVNNHGFSSICMVKA
jgi:hypothetical protein